MCALSQLLILGATYFLATTSGWKQGAPEREATPLITLLYNCRFCSPAERTLATSGIETDHFTPCRLLRESIFKKEGHVLAEVINHEYQWNER